MIKKRTAVWLLLITLIVVGVYLVWSGRLRLPGTYSAKDFGVETVKSRVDFDGDGVDDYTDILRGARRDAGNMPVYKSAYYEGGYPPQDEGVCTDLVWRALAYAGYNLKALVDEDVAENTAAYPRVNGRPDPNIVFRRVANLKVFLERNCTCLTLDPNDIAMWQPGDIVTYGTNHIGVVSDKRDPSGVPYIIHNTGQPVREEDMLNQPSVSGHFRFDIDMGDFAIQPDPPEWKSGRKPICTVRSDE